MIGQSAMLFSSDESSKDSGAIILKQLANERAAELAEKQEKIPQGLSRRLGTTQTLLSTRRLLRAMIILNEEEFLIGNSFQQNLWLALRSASWTSATAPTAAGKTFLVLNWLISEVSQSPINLAIFIAPTRALVSEVENELLSIKRSRDLPALRIGSLPLPEYGDKTKPTILVFTQERLHLFLNSFEDAPEVDVTIVDEVQKLNDGVRGVILQDAIERVFQSNNNGRFVFLSPLSKNPETLVAEAPEGAPTAIIPSGPPTVTQNLIEAEQVRGKTKVYNLRVAHLSDGGAVGHLTLHDRPASKGGDKKLAFVALAIGRNDKGTLVYANGSAEAEKIAQQLFDALDDVDDSHIDSELQDLSDFCRTAIHPRFQMVRLVKRGIAFHYGNMPSLLRHEIERLFRQGKIRFLVCTSTLIEGVNLACRNIVMKGPRKGRDTPMEPQDFWNLAGRAGRWGADFHGNIICVNPSDERLWPHGVPNRETFTIIRETDKVIDQSDALLSYIRDRIETPSSPANEDLESVTAYLMGWFARTGTTAYSPSMRSRSQSVVEEFDETIGKAFSSISIPQSIIASHPSISALSLQNLANYFSNYEGDIEDLLPPFPEDENPELSMRFTFHRIDGHLFPAFGNEKREWAAAYTTVDWMRGIALSKMISGAVRRWQKKNEGNPPYATIIRATMRSVEEIARFLAPKYLSAYVDVLKWEYERRDLSEQFPYDLKLDLFLEFGVSTTTMLSFIGLGMTRTSAVELNDFLSRTDLSEEEALSYLREGAWEDFDLPRVVKRDIRTVVSRHEPIGAESY